MFFKHALVCLFTLLFFFRNDLLHKDPRNQIVFFLSGVSNQFIQHTLHRTLRDLLLILADMCQFVLPGSDVVFIHAAHFYSAL